MSKKSGIIEDLMELAARLPWQLGVGLAVVSYFVFHYFATKSVPTIPSGDVKPAVKALGEVATAGLWSSIARILQYLVPLALLVGAGVSAIRGNNKRR